LPPPLEDLAGLMSHDPHPQAAHQHASPQHGHHQHDAEAVACAVVTVSDTRKRATDRSGQAIVAALEQAGHRVVRREIVPDGPETLGPLLDELAEAAATVEAILISGGTGFSPRDLTPQVVAARLDLEMPGFGERLRAVSVAEIGPRAMLSRALAGRMGRQAVFVMPGSRGAVQTALDHCILPTLRHLVGQIRQPA